MKKFLEIGKIVNTHGVNGTVKAEPWCDSPMVLAKIRTLYLKKKANGENTVCADGAFFMPIKVIAASVHKEHVLIHFEGSDTFDTANKYRNTVIFADRNDIATDKNAVFIDDMIGLPVIDCENGRLYGYLKDVITGGVQDIYEVTLADGIGVPNPENPDKPRFGYMPAVKQFVERIDVESGIFIRYIDGLFD